MGFISSFQRARRITCSRTGFVRVWCFRRNVCTEQLHQDFKFTVKNNKFEFIPTIFLIEKRLLGLRLQSPGMKTSYKTSWGAYGGASRDQSQGITPKYTFSNKLYRKKESICLTCSWRVLPVCLVLFEGRVGIKGYHSPSLAGYVNNFKRLNSGFKTLTGGRKR